MLTIKTEGREEGPLWGMRVYMGLTDRMRSTSLLSQLLDLVSREHVDVPHLTRGSGTPERFWHAGRYFKTTSACVLYETG